MSAKASSDLRVVTTSDIYGAGHPLGSKSTENSSSSKSNGTLFSGLSDIVVGIDDVPVGSLSRASSYEDQNAEFVACDTVSGKKFNPYRISRNGIIILFLYSIFRIY